MGTNSCIDLRWISHTVPINAFWKVTKVLAGYPSRVITEQSYRTSVIKNGLPTHQMRLQFTEINGPKGYFIGLCWNFVHEDVYHENPSLLVAISVDDPDSLSRIDNSTLRISVEST